MTTSNKPSVLFWIVASLALLWNLVGLSEFIRSAFIVESYVDQYTDVQMDAIRNSPIWSLVLFGISTITGVLGGLFLLLRKKKAILLFAISLFTVLFHTLGTILLLDGIAIFGIGQGLIFPLVILLLDLFFYWFSKWSYRKGWLQ